MITVPRYRTEDGIEEICFTTEPVHSCEGHCVWSSSRRVELQFTCMPQDSPATRMMYDRSLYQPLTELRNYPVHMTDGVNVQDICTPVN